MTTSTWTILDHAHTALRAATAALTTADLGRATPCAEWTVAQVLQHAAGDQLAYVSAITGEGGPAENPFAPSGVLAGTPAELVEPALTASAVAFASVDPAASTPTPLPQGALPAATAAGAAALDAGVHAWDVAVATGQRSPLDDELAARLLSVARAIVEPLRPYGAYAPALESHEDDGAAAELLRYLGRDPHWSPAR
ncbi:TIGR03086 family metal-binding protein [Actinoplanes sp. KI2]|uniref:TIGR03086 family metal-binding protein n=1 Tax=Actinoplanes sp. KI2 TaxID=2983315 RepID=UPI0021D5B0B0|nr:TIGR03086 family metal-binding protein [Actinoplanes sp. KI2]MCU7729134.1 TIGR03086 family metal-binding protein [Actinoplanes sp. KI2]